MKDTKEMGGQSVCYTTEILAIHMKEIIFSKEKNGHGLRKDVSGGSEAQRMHSITIRNR